MKKHILNKMKKIGLKKLSLEKRKNKKGDQYKILHN
jgi:hypothetical protein